MHVANVILEGRYGGPQARIARVAEILDERGCHTTVICPDQGSETFTEELEKKGVEYETASLHALGRGFSRFSAWAGRFPSEVNALRSIIGDCGVDIVHCNGSWQYKGLVAGVMEEKNTIWHLNDTNTPKLVQRAFNWLAPRVADGFIVASERTRKYYLDDAQVSVPCKLINAPVDESVFAPSKVARSDELEEYDGIKVLTVANISPVKDLETFIQAASFVGKRTEEKVNFFVAGQVFETQKHYARQVKRYAAALGVKNVHFLGYRENIATVYRSSHIYVCSSAHEASPTSVWEAMSMALPVVSTDVGDVRRHLKGGGFRRRGYIVEVGDGEAMGKYIQSLIKDPERRGRIGRRARKYACREFGLDECVRRHLAIYREVMR